MHRGLNIKTIVNNYQNIDTNSDNNNTKSSMFYSGMTSKYTNMNKSILKFTSDMKRKIILK